MELIFHNAKNGSIAEYVTPTLLQDLDDFLDLLGNASYQNAYKVIVHKSQLPNNFFDLKTRIAGEILQKFSTYNMQLAIVGDFENIESKSLRDFIRESNRVGRIVFVESLEKAIEVLDR